jgi:hypothetical protein
MGTTARMQEVDRVGNTRSRAKRNPSNNFHEEFRSMGFGWRLSAIAPALPSITCSRRDLPPPSVGSSIACSRRDLPRPSLGSYLLHERQGWRECRDCTTAGRQEVGNAGALLPRSKSLPLQSYPSYGKPRGNPGTVVHNWVLCCTVSSSSSGEIRSISGSSRIAASRLYLASHCRLSSASDCR